MCKLTNVFVAILIMVLAVPSCLAGDISNGREVQSTAIQAISTTDHGDTVGSFLHKRVGHRIFAFQGQCSKDDDCGVGWKCCKTSCEQVATCGK